jgi:hypothetical protein
MGADRGADGLIPPRILVDDSATVDEAAARHAVRGAIATYGVAWFWLGAVNVVLGVLDLSLHRPTGGAFGWFYLAVGVWYVVMTRYGNRPCRHPIVPTEVVFADAGLVVSVRGESSARTYPWKRVRTAINSDAFFIIVVGTAGLVMMQRTIYVPKPDDAALCAATWSALYAHMVARRGLRATPLERLGLIRNSAVA